MGCTHFALNSYMAVQMFCTTVHLYNVHCTHEYWRQPGLSRWRILTNESTSRITFMNRDDQSQGLKSARTTSDTTIRVGDIMKASVLRTAALKTTKILNRCRKGQKHHQEDWITEGRFKRLHSVVRKVSVFLRLSKA